MVPTPPATTPAKTAAAYLATPVLARLRAGGSTASGVGLVTAASGSVGGGGGVAVCGFAG